MTCISRLLSGSPGTIAGPVSPPASSVSRDSSFNPPLSSPTWQSPHVSSRTGRMFASKNSVCSAVGAGAWTGVFGGRAKEGGFAGRAKGAGFAGRAKEAGFAGRAKEAGFAGRAKAAGFAGRASSGAAAATRSTATAASRPLANPIHLRGRLTGVFWWRTMTNEPVTGYYAATLDRSLMHKLISLAFGTAFALFVAVPGRTVIAERGQTPAPGAQAPPQTAVHPKRPGVTTPGVRIPIMKLKPDAVYAVPGAPDWMAVDKEVWVSNEPKNSVSRLDPKSSAVMATITVGKEPCSGLAAGFGSLWVPNCGDSTVTRLNLEDGKPQATFAMTIGNSEGGVTIGGGSFWILTDTKGTLARVDA